MDLYIHILLHDLKNQLQKILAALYLYPDNTNKIQEYADKMCQLIKIHEKLYINYDYDSTAILISSIQALYPKQLTFDIGIKIDQHLFQVVMTYCLWIGKYHYINIKSTNPNQITIDSPDVEIGELYKLDDETYSTYANLIHQINHKQNIKIQNDTNKIILSIE